jgi:DNA repair protein RadC
MNSIRSEDHIETTAPFVFASDRPATTLTVAECLAAALHEYPTWTDIDNARQLLQQAGSVREALRTTPQLRAIHELACRGLFEQLCAKPAITDPRDSAAFLKAQLAHKPYEVFACLFLDNRHRVLAFEELFRGTLDGASVHPREVVHASLKHNAAAVILAHNHPSGVAEPSAADRNITRQLRDALQLIGTRVLDHLVIGAGEPVSMAARGLI